MTVVFERYNHPGNFHWVDDVFRDEYFAFEVNGIAVASASFFCLNVLAALHNNLMSSENSTWIKAPGAIVLAAAALCVSPIALVEGFVFFMAMQVSYIFFVVEAWRNKASISFEFYLSAGLALSQTLNAFPTALRMLINDSDVVVYNPLRPRRIN